MFPIHLTALAVVTASTLSPATAAPIVIDSRSSPQVTTRSLPDGSWSVRIAAAGLSTDAGTRRLVAAIEAAATRACADVHPRSSARACTREVAAEARRSADIDRREMLARR